MKNNNSPVERHFPRRIVGASMLALATLLSACASDPPAPAVPPANVASATSEEPGPLAVLAYYQSLQRMSAVQINRERVALVALPQSPGLQLRVAMLLGHPRGQQDLAKALSLLDGILKSSDPAAVSLQPLARLLADNYGERQRLETQLEKQGQQLKESQRKAIELQEKIDGLADIERTLPQRPRATRPGSTAR